MLTTITAIEGVLFGIGSLVTSLLNYRQIVRSFSLRYAGTP